MDQLKSNFKGFDIWDSIEAKLAIMCADIDEPTTEPKKHELISRLVNIEKYLLTKGIDAEHTKFIRDEIDRYKYTRQISLYVEKEDSID